MAAVAVAAFVVLGGTAWAMTRGEDNPNSEISAGQDGDTGDENDPGSPSTLDSGAGQDGTGDEGSGAQGSLPGQTESTAGRTDTTAGRTDTTTSRTTVRNGVTTTHHDSTTTAANETTTTTDPTTTSESTTSTTVETTTTETTAAQAEAIRIVSRPRVNSRGPTSFQFNYSTNDVCGTGGFTVKEKASGRSVGSFRGENVCYGPVHGGFPNGSGTFSGFDLAPGTTYRVTVTVKGTTSDGVRPTGQGSDSASFEVTTTE